MDTRATNPLIAIAFYRSPFSALQLFLSFFLITPSLYSGLLFKIAEVYEEKMI